MNDPYAAVGWTTIDTEEKAKQLCRSLVEQKLVACAQISAPIFTIYSWESEVHEDEEFRITLKFLDSKAEAIETFLKSNHPYDTFQWLWARVEEINGDYFKWMEGTTS